jgi:hypothetical protein
MRTTTEAFDLEIAVASVQSVADRRRRLSRSLKAEHTRIPSLASQTVGIPSYGSGALSLRSYRLAEKVLSGLCCHSQNFEGARRRQQSRYTLRYT